MPEMSGQQLDVLRYVNAEQRGSSNSPPPELLNRG